MDGSLVSSLQQLIMVMYLSCKERDTVDAVKEVNRTIVDCLRGFLDSLDLDMDRKYEIAVCAINYIEEKLGDLLNG